MLRKAAANEPTAGIADDAVGNTKLDLTANYAFTGTITGTPLGLKEADEWRLTTSFLVASGTDIASNLERNDTASFAQVGTGMSESSGAFTFPSTGIYQISCRGNWLYTQTGVNPHNGLLIRYTTDNSSYSNLAYSYSYIGSSSGDDWFAFTYSTGLFRVANTTTHKVKFRTGTKHNNYTTLAGASDSNATTFTFMKMGDL